MSTPKKLTKPEQTKLNKRMKVLEHVQMGLGSILGSEVIQLGLELATRARRVRSDIRIQEGVLDPISDQLYRSLNSVTANLIEGTAKVTTESIINFGLIARGSAYESVMHAKILELGWVRDIERLCILVDDFVAHSVRSEEQCEEL